VLAIEAQRHRFRSGVAVPTTATCSPQATVVSMALRFHEELAQARGGDVVETISKLDRGPRDWSDRSVLCALAGTLGVLPRDAAVRLETGELAVVVDPWLGEPASGPAVEMLPERSSVAALGETRPAADVSWNDEAGDEPAAPQRVSSEPAVRSSRPDSRPSPPPSSPAEPRSDRPSSSCWGLRADAPSRPGSELRTESGGRSHGDAEPLAVQPPTMRTSPPAACATSEGRERRASRPGPRSIDEVQDELAERLATLPAPRPRPPSTRPTCCRALSSHAPSGSASPAGSD
jgi:hypothetical protein